LQLLFQVDPIPQASAFSGKDRLNDEAKFIDQAKLDQLGGDGNTAEQDIPTWFPFQFKNFILRPRTNNSRIVAPGPVKRLREDNEFPGGKCIRKFVFCFGLSMISRDIGPIGNHLLIGFASKDELIDIPEKLRMIFK